jgi:hypothetical protein
LILLDEAFRKQRYLNLTFLQVKYKFGEMSSQLLTKAGVKTVFGSVKGDYQLLKHDVILHAHVIKQQACQVSTVLFKSFYVLAGMGHATTSGEMQDMLGFLKSVLHN